MTALRHFADALRTAFVDVVRRPLFSALSVAAMTVAVLVLAGFVLVSRGAERVFGDLAQQSAIEIYVRPDVRDEDVEALSRALAQHPAVESIERVSAQRALDELVRLYPELGQADELLGENPLSESLRIRQRPGAVPGATVTSGIPSATPGTTLDELVRYARARPIVLSVRYDREWIEALARAGRALRGAGLAGALILLGAALVTVGSVVRLALDDKLDEVRLLRVVGAPISYVLAPVLLSGALLGGFGTALALLAVTLVRTRLLAWTAEIPFAKVAAGAPLPVPVFALILVLGAAAGAFAAGVAAGRAALR